MKQRETIFNLTEQGMNAKEIQKQLQIQYGQQAFSTKTVYKWRAIKKLGLENDLERDTPGPKPDEQLLERINQIFIEKPFSSIRSISRELNENVSTIYRYTTDYLGRVYRLTKWVPHNLNSIQKQKKVNDSNQLKIILTRCKHESWRNIVTGDQSWITIYTPNSGKWVLIDEESPEEANITIGVQKIMLTVIWGVNGMYVIDFLPPSTPYNSSYFITNVLDILNEKRNDIWSQSQNKQIWLHLDNSMVHNSRACSQKIEQIGFKRAPHPPYSPDIAPSDYYLFGYLKGQLKGLKFNDLDELKEKVIEILTKISRDVKKRVFDHWIERCQWIIDNNGAYYKG